MDTWRNRTHRWSACALLLALIPLGGPAAAETADRNAAWAKPIPLEGAGNLFQVSEILYRSAQPTPDGLKRLKEIGVRTVINLRAFHNDVTADRSADLLDEELSVKTWHIEDEDVIRVMRILREPAEAPFLIHCQHGADRTGLMVAMYRIIYQHWTKDQAIDELVHGGFGFHAVWGNILEYIRQADVAALTGLLAH